MFFKICFLKNFTTSLHGKTPVLERSATLLKGDSNKGVSCEYCGILRNRFFYRTHLMDASVQHITNIIITPYVLQMLLIKTNNESDHDHTSWPPRLKLTLPWWGGFPPRSFYQSASTRRAQLSVAAKVVRPTDLLQNVRYWFTIWLDKIRKTFSS